MPSYREVTIDDIDRLYDGWDGWDYTYMQLTPGRLGDRNCVVEFDGIRVEWHEYRQRVLFRDEKKTTNVHFGLLLEADAPPRIFGNLVPPSSGLIHYKNVVNEYILEPGSKTLNVSLSPRLTDELGWDLSGPSIRDLAPDNVAALSERCEELGRMSSAEANRSEAGTIHEFLDTFESTLKPWLTCGGRKQSVEPTRSYQIAREAEALMDLVPCDEKPDVGSVAATLGCSQRAIYAAFQEWLGLGPYEFYQLKKLHAFRRLLLMGSPYHGKVTRVALRSGFLHFGRLAKLYRRHFGESPRETLNRRYPKSK